MRWNIPTFTKVKESDLTLEHIGLMLFAPFGLTSLVATGYVGGYVQAMNGAGVDTLAIPMAMIILTITIAAPVGMGIGLYGRYRNRKSREST